MTGVTCRCDVGEPTMPSNMALTSLVVCADAKAVQVISRILREMGIIQPGEEAAGVNKVLNAAALTYIAAFIAALGNLLWLMSLRDRR